MMNFPDDMVTRLNKVMTPLGNHLSSALYHIDNDASISIINVIDNMIDTGIYRAVDIQFDDRK